MRLLLLCKDIVMHGCRRHCFKRAIADPSLITLICCVRDMVGTASNHSAEFETAYPTLAACGSFFSTIITVITTIITMMMTNISSTIINNAILLFL